MLYCVFRIPNAVFLHSNNLIARNQNDFLKIYANIYTFFSFTQFDSTKPIQLLKTYEKNVYKCIGFLHINYKFQQYAKYNDTKACVNRPFDLLLFPYK